MSIPYTYNEEIVGQWFSSFSIDPDLNKDYSLTLRLRLGAWCKVVKEECNGAISIR